MKALLIGIKDFKQEYLSAGQLYPFFDYRPQLQRRLGLKFQHFAADRFSEIETICQQNPADVFFIRPHWQETADAAEQTLSRLRQTYPESKIFLIDPYDQVSSLYFGALPYIDRLIKYQALKDVETYYRPLHGGTVLTDRLVREMGYDLQGWEVTSAVPAGYADRIVPGWFISLIPEFKKYMVNPVFSRQLMPKSIDIACHISLGPKQKIDWYGQLRMQSFEAIQALPSRYSRAISGEFLEERTVSHRQYLYDLQRSRIAISPFGWGELSFRDYEAARHHCLLIKPSVEHIATEPNIYIPYETYVPVRWDYADLEEKCRYYLEHPEETKRIVHNARQAYIRYCREGGFVRCIESLISGSSISQPAAA